MNSGHFCLVDFETGGLDVKINPITEVGIYTFRADTFEEISRYQSYVKPYDDKLVYNPDALNITGITMNQINSGKPLKQVVEEMILEFEKGKSGKGRNSKPHIIGHNIYEFDKRFLEDIFGRCKKDVYKFIDTYYYDTLKMARAIWTDVDGQKFSLEVICEKLGVELIDGHGAINDCIANAEVFKKILALTRNDGGGVYQGIKEKRTRETFKFEY